MDGVARVAPIAAQKTETVLFTNRRRYNLSTFRLKGVEIGLCTVLKYLGLCVDGELLLSRAHEDGGRESRLKDGCPQQAYEESVRIERSSLETVDERLLIDTPMNSSLASPAGGYRNRRYHARLR